MYLVDKKSRPWLTSLAIVVLMSFVFAFGLLIGQRNLYNQTNKTELTIRTEKGSVDNIFSQINSKPIWGLQDKPKESGSFSSYVDTKTNQTFFKFELKTDYYTLEKQLIPTEYNIVLVYINQENQTIEEETLGQIELKKIESGLQENFFGQYTLKPSPLQLKQVVLKTKNKDQEQSAYLYNDKSLGENLNNTNMPYFWVKII